MADHAFKTIGRDIKENRIGNLVFFYGKEQYLTDWAVNLMVESYVNEATKQLDLTMFQADSCTVDDIVGACETMAMLSEKKVVVVRYTGQKPKVKEGELCSYFPEIPQSTLLILAFYDEEIPKNIAEKGTKAVKYNFATLDEKTLISFIAKEMKSAGKTSNMQTVRNFINESGYYHKESTYTLYNLKNDILKLAAHADGDMITMKDVEAVTSGNLDRNVFTMVECVCRNRKGEAIKILHNMLSAKASAFGIATNLISQFELILEIKELRDQAYNLQQIQKVLKIHEYRIKKAMTLVSRYSVKELNRILIKAYSIDNEIKSGEVSEELALELFISEI